MFSGSMDDETAGGDGIAHWFEHVPFRGTENYPQGEEQIIGPIERHGGDLNAYTSQCLTAYHATTPKHIWRQGLEVITDLAGKPLMTDESIDAEREIILSEIARARGKAVELLWHEALPQLWPNHPLGHPVLGTPTSLSRVSAETVRAAHQLLYCRSRASLFLSGDIAEEELISAARETIAKIPQRLSDQRRGPVWYGVLPPWKPQSIEIEEKVDPSVVVMAWPFPASSGILDTLTQRRLYLRLRMAFTAGMLCSPLLRIVRRERKLVYGAQAHFFTPSLDGGVFYLMAETDRREKVPAIQAAFRDVISGEQIRSAEWDQYLRDFICGGREMRIDEPEGNIAVALGRILCDGMEPMDDDNWYEGLLDVPHKEVLALLNQLTPEQTTTITLLGKK
jgi:predicted Zn-dependent peptidase